MEKTFNILVVEDNHLDAELALHSFDDADVAADVQVARTGEEALDRVFGRGEFADRSRFPLPDLLLIDLKLKGLDGSELLRQIKESARYRRIPAIVLSSSREARDVEFCYDHGANGYLVKPVSYRRFRELMLKVFEYWSVLNVPAPVEGTVADREGLH